MELPFECFSHNFCANYEIWKIRVVVLLLVINILSVLFSMLFQTMIVSVWYLLYMYPHVLQRRDISSHYDGWMPSEMRFTCSQFLPTKVRDICKFATIQCENALKWTKESMKTTCCLTCLHIKCCCSVTYLGTKLYSKCTKLRINFWKIYTTKKICNQLPQVMTHLTPCLMIALRTVTLPGPLPAPPHRRRIPQQVCGGYKALGKPPRGCFSAFKTATRRNFQHFVRTVITWMASISQLSDYNEEGWQL